MKKCVSCGLDIEDGVKFCMHCGASQPVEPAAPAVPAEPAAEAPAAAAAPSAPAAEESASAQKAEPAVRAEPPAAPEAPKTQTVHFSAPAGASRPAQEHKPPVFTPTPVPTVDPERPAPKSRYALLSTWGTVGALLLMNIPVIGLIFMIVWACGGCRKYAKRNLARAELILIAASILINVILLLVLRFAFPELLIQLYELTHPGYTIIF